MLLLPARIVVCALAYNIIIALFEAKKGKYNFKRCKKMEQKKVRI